MDIKEVEHYVENIIPKLERDLTDTSKTDEELSELYNLYEGVLNIVAPYDFDSFNKFLEFEEDKTESNTGFHYHRRNHMWEVHEVLNDMEIYDKYDTVLISLPPRTGKTTYSIRFMAWIIGRYPEHTQLGTSYSSSVTSSFYNGMMELVTGERYNRVFPDAPLMAQNAKRQEIWLKTIRRYPSVSFVPIGGSVTGVGEASKYLYVDDLVSGAEEAMSPTRLDKLWEIFTTNFYQRKKNDSKMLVIGTRWSVHDPLTRLEQMYEGDERFKTLKIPALDAEGKSNFDYVGGFDETYYEETRRVMDELSFNALYQQEPVEREGLLYHEEDMKYYLELPEDKPDAIVSVCDSKNLGKDYVASPIGYVYGDTVYIDDVVYNDGLPEATVPLVGNKWMEHNVTRGDIELNNGGNYYAENVGKHIKKHGGNTSIRMFFTGNNKDVKIITYADYVTKNFVFRDSSTYSENSEYAAFMRGIFSWTQTGKNRFDDAPDSIAMLAQMVQELQGSSVKVLNRSELGI